MLHIEGVKWITTYETKVLDAFSQLRSAIGEYSDKKTILKTLNDYQIPICMDFFQYMIMKIYSETKDYSA